MTAPETLFVGTTAGLETALSAELEALGFSGQVSAGGVTLHTAPGSYRHINLWSRIASRVLLRVAEVSTPEALKQLSLRAYGSSFEVDAFGESAGKWGTAVTSTPGGTRLLLRGQGGRCQVSVDTTGELLHFRGYRQEVGRAPMRETLAAGMLRLAKWAPEEPLWDVMCGSGTLVIEAAEQVLGLAPGRNRQFAFERFPGHDEAAWRALPRSKGATSGEVRGSDLNAGALGVARRNAARAEVQSVVQLERLDATSLPPRGAKGLVVANLPYGKRVGAKDELGQLYRAVGKSLSAACPGWYFALLVEAGAEHLGLKIAECHRLENGGLDCELVLGQL